MADIFDPFAENTNELDQTFDPFGASGADDPFDPFKEAKPADIFDPFSDLPTEPSVPPDAVVSNSSLPADPPSADLPRPAPVASPMQSAFDANALLREQEMAAAAQAVSQPVDMPEYDWNAQTFNQYPDGVPAPKLIEPSIFNPETRQRMALETVANEQPGPTQLKADLGMYKGRDDIGTAFQYGDMSTQANIQNMLADTEAVLRETSFAKFMQNIQNKGLPFINSVRGMVGAEPLPEDATTQASVAKEAELRNSAAAVMQQAESLGFKPLGLNEIDSFKDFLRWGLSTAGASGAPMLVTMATGGTISPLVMGSEVNSSLAEIEGLSPEDRLKLAYSAGAIAGVLENLGLGILVKGLPREVVGKLGAETFSNYINKTYGGRVAAAFTEAMASEAATEAGQEALFIGTEAIAGKEFQDGEIGQRLLESAAGGAVIGGPIGGGRSVISEKDDATTKAVKEALSSIEGENFSPEAINAAINALKGPQTQQDVQQPEVSPSQDAPIVASRPTAQTVTQQNTPQMSAPPSVPSPNIETPEEPQPVQAQTQAAVLTQDEQDFIAGYEQFPLPENKAKYDELIAKRDAGQAPQAPDAPTRPQIAQQSPQNQQQAPEDDGFNPPELSVKPIRMPLYPTASRPGPVELGEGMEITAPTADEPYGANNPQHIPMQIPSYSKEAQAFSMGKAEVQAPDGSANYVVQTQIVDLADLKTARGDLQPRDRDLKESAAQILRNASPERFNPSRLMEAPTIDDGAPIIARDGTILSGNGRAMTLVEVFNNHPESRQRYIEEMRKNGVTDEVIAQFRNPVMVRFYQNKVGSLDPNVTPFEELLEFTRLANKDNKAGMTATEVAQSDAKAMTTGMINLYQGGDFTSLENRSFVENFVRTVVSPNELNNFSRNGKPTQAGIQRMKAAVLASAYEDTEVLAAMLDSTDDNVRAISNAMMQTAPLIAGLKADIKAGRIQEEFDISGQISQAVQTIRNLRENGVKPRDFLAQQDAFTETDPVVEAIIRAFYNEELTRAKSQAFMVDVLKFYAEEAANRQTDALFADETTAPDVINAAKNKAERTRDEAAKPQKPATWAGERTGAVEGANAGGKQAQSTKREGSRKKPSVQAETAVDTNAQQVSQAARELEETGPTSNVDDVQPSTKGIMTGRVFMARSETLRQSTYRGAFAEAGVSPDQAANLSIQRQYNILSKLVQEKFGLTFIAPPRDGASYDQVNALLDAYHNLQWMAHTLAMPNKAIGLDGSLGLALPSRTWGGYLGAYIPQGGMPTNVQSDIKPITGAAIIMPRRSNSFAHEWGHALDFYLMDKYGSDTNDGITGVVRSNLKNGERPWQSGAPLSVQEAMAGVINAMFYDKAELSLKIMQMEHHIAKLEAREAKSGKRIKKLDDLREQLTKLKEGSGRTKVDPSEYRKTSAQYGASAGMKDYYLKPTEMFARAMEAYIARSVEAAGGRNEFITKGDDAYQMTLEQVQGADERLALTFPKDEDRMNIFLAMDRLMEAVRTEAIQNGPVAEAPGGLDAIDATSEFNGTVAATKRTKLLEMPKAVAKAIIDDQVRAWRVSREKLKQIRLRPSEYTGETRTARTVAMLQDTVGANLLETKRQVLFNISKRYKNNARVHAVMEKIIARVATDPGSLTNRVTVKNGTFEEATRKFSRRNLAVYNNILNKYKLDEMTASDQERLRLMLTGDEAAWRNAPENLSKAAGELRTRLLNPLYDYMVQNGLEINYVQGAGYMPRMMDNLLAVSKAKEFLSKKTPGRGAYALYAEVIYENEYGAFEEGNMEQIGGLISLANMLDRKNIPLPTATENRIRQLKKLRSDINAKNNEIESRQKAGEDTDAQEAQLAKMSEQISEIHEQVYEDLRDPYAETAAKDWHARIIQRNAADPAAHGPQGGFANKRKLPPEADKYMVDFYLPVHEAILEYIPAVVRKTEWEARFGTHLVPKGQKKKTKGAYPGQQDATKDYLEYLLEQAVDAGMKPHEKHEVLGLVNRITGRHTGTDYNFDKVMNFMNLWGTMSLLERAVMSSIVEPMTVAVQTGRVRDGLKNMAYAFDGAWGRIGTAKAAERRVYYEQLANILGVIDLPQTGDMIANRLGGTSAEDAKSAGRLSLFFVRSGLTALTNAQRKGTMRVGIQFIEGVAKQYQQSNGRMKEEARQILGDFGIGGNLIEPFTEYAANLQRNGDGLIEIDQILEASGQLTEMGDVLATAVGRFIDQTIQDPKIVDRPKWAESPVGRMVFGIQSFIAAFQRNVLEMSAKRLIRDVKTKGAVRAVAPKVLGGDGALIGKTVLPLASLYGSHLVLTTLRELIFNREKWEEESEKDNLEWYLAKMAFSRAGFFGRSDPIVNGFVSYRYQADLSNVLVGASAAYYLKAVQRMYGAFTDNNSPNTVAAEYQAWRGAYDVVVPILGGLVQTYPGFGSALGYTFGAINAAAQSPTATHWVTRNVVKELYGEEYRPRGGHRQKKKDEKKTTW